MSSRALRRLEQQRLKDSLKEESEIPDGNESDEGPAPAQSKFNAFALLNGDDSESEPSEAEEEKVIVKETTKATPKSTKSKKKKNKNHQCKKKLHQLNHKKRQK